MTIGLIDQYLCIVVGTLPSLCVCIVYSLVPRPLPKEGRGPGTHCLRMRENTPGFYGGSYNSIPYRRLYPWTVRDRPFYCLGVALRIWPVVASFLPLSPTLFLKLEKKDWC